MIVFFFIVFLGGLNIIVDLLLWITRDYDTKAKPVYYYNDIVTGERKRCKMQRII